MAKRIKWSEDELVLALELYHTHFPIRQPNANDPLIVKICQQLRRLGEVKYGKENLAVNFRSANSIRRRFANFAFLDPNRPNGMDGSTGPLVRMVWNKYYQNRSSLTIDANKIKTLIKGSSPELKEESLSNDTMVYTGTSVWDLIKARAGVYALEQLKFYSARNKKSYTVKTIHESKITIARQDGDDVDISMAMFVNKANAVAEKGMLDDSEISTTVAIKTAIVELHPYLSYFNDHIIRYRCRSTGTTSAVDTDLEKSEYIEPFDPAALQDARKRIIRAINVRRGQGKFRAGILKAYNHRCCISECIVDEVNEAAHIIPYIGDTTNDIRNGLLLRADIHTLFDRHMIWIDPEDWTVHIDSTLLNSEYKQYAGAPFYPPQNKADWPDRTALIQHMDICDPNYD